MADALRKLTFTRKNSLVPASVFEAGLHTDAALEALVEDTRNTVLAWVGALAPELAGPAAHCLDLLALLPPELAQRLSIPGERSGHAADRLLNRISPFFRKGFGCSVLLSKEKDPAAVVAVGMCETPRGVLQAAG